MEVWLTHTEAVANREGGRSTSPVFFGWSEAHVSSEPLDGRARFQLEMEIVSEKHEWLKVGLSASKESNKTRHLRCSSPKKKGGVKGEREMSTFNGRSVPNSIQQDCDEVLLMAGSG